MFSGDKEVKKIKEVRTVERSVQTKRMKQESLYLTPDDWLNPEIYEFQLQVQRFYVIFLKLKFCFD